MTDKNPFVSYLSRIFLAGLLVVLTGCATQNVTQVTLSGMVIGGTPATGQVGPESLRLTRGASQQTAAPDTVLQPGDAIWTGPNTEAVISYPSGARAYLRPNTQVSIGSLFVEIGKVFVKVRGVFQVKTAFVTAASEGTEYWVEVQPAGVRTVVAEGQVNFYSNAGAWSRPLGPTEQAASRGAMLQMSGAANPAEIRQELEWVRRMDTQVPLKTVAGTPALIGVGAAAAAGLWWINKDKDRKDRPPPSPSGSGRYDPPSPGRHQ